MRWRRTLLAAALMPAIHAYAAARVPTQRASGRIDVHTEVLQDGTELILFRIGNARRASLRYVVRAGGAFDPPAKYGLAHLVEHVVASARDGSERLTDVVTAAGGVMNAFTSRDATWYALDAPVLRFPELARKLLVAVTNPRFEPAEVAAAQGVVASEQEASGDSGFLGMVEAAIFSEPSGTLLGTAGSRDRVTREDVLDFYRARYLANMTTVVIAGDFTPEAARELVEGVSALPPALSTERFGPRRTTPGLPIEQAVQAPFHAVVIGYRVDEADWSACLSAADLLKVRLTYLYQLKRPVIAWANVGCHRLRGVPLLLIAAYARSLEQESLPEIIDSTYRNAVARPMNDQERGILELRRSRTVDWLRDSPERIAEAAAELVAAPRDDEPTPVGQLETAVVPPAELRSFAGRTFVRERRLSLTFTPY